MTLHTIVILKEMEIRNTLRRLIFMLYTLFFTVTDTAAECEIDDRGFGKMTTKRYSHIVMNVQKRLTTDHC